VDTVLTTDCRFEGIEPLLTDYRIIGGGLSANIERQYDAWENMLVKASGYAPEFVAAEGHRARAYQLRYLARRAIQMGDARLALRLLMQALNASRRPLIEEPAKTLESFSAALVAWIIGPKILTRLAAYWTRAGVVA
jgi:hypothetical protein